MAVVGASPEGVHHRPWHGWLPWPARGIVGEGSATKVRSTPTAGRYPAAPIGRWVGDGRRPAAGAAPHRGGAQRPARPSRSRRRPGRRPGAAVQGGREPPGLRAGAGRLVASAPVRVVHATAPTRICDLGGWTDTWF